MIKNWRRLGLGEAVLDGLEAPLLKEPLPRRVHANLVGNLQPADVLAGAVAVPVRELRRGWILLVDGDALDVRAGVRRGDVACALVSCCRKGLAVVLQWLSRNGIADVGGRCRRGLTDAVPQRLARNGGRATNDAAAAVGGRRRRRHTATSASRVAVFRGRAGVARRGPLPSKTAGCVARPRQQ
eukprot:TRINITY_DN1426_c1_g1_i1.p2 TRINITY_DN1426_c1_g1~~TRINITY_DN1426_c1_g1_i1.p2  ORF type:complete len:184 (-),score=12.53 TRINITY_DN1426_c1_g1_i1:33-584(-)